MSARESSLPPTNRKDVPVTTPGGHRIQLRVFPAAQSSSVVIVAGAMGVGQHCYEKFARYLSSQGFTAITFDYFGMGASQNSHLRDCPVKVTEWGSEDCRAVIDFARQHYSGQRLQWIGHSVGGQLLGMTPNVNDLDHAVTVACGSGYWRENSPPTKRIAWFLWYFMAPVSVRMFGYFPGKRLNIVGDLPPNVIRQWRQWCLDPEYAVGKEGRALRDQFAAVKVPISAVAFSDDEMMSRRNVDSLHSFYTHAAVTMHRVNPKEVGESRIGHLGWFREQYETSIWQNTLLPLLR